MPPARHAARAAPPAPAGAPVRGRSYEQLVAEADRALENGNTAKAQKLIDEALRLQPSGVAAVTSSAYLLLDKQKPLAAVGEFKRALNLAPNFPQALFGLGEAYRASGNAAQAIEAYKRYLAAAPDGSDAPAAHRQIRELESQPARPSHSTAATVPARAPPRPRSPKPSRRSAAPAQGSADQPASRRRRVDDVREHVDDLDDRLHRRGAVDLSGERRRRVAAVAGCASW